MSDATSKSAKKRDFAINALQRGEIFQNTRDVFAIDREDEKLLRRRMKECVALTQTKSMPRNVFITTESVKENVHSGIVQASVTADDLFARPAS